jgi:hypothetical protein
MEDLVTKTIDLDPMINYPRRVQIVRGALEKIHDGICACPNRRSASGRTPFANSTHRLGPTRSSQPELAWAPKCSAVKADTGSAVAGTTLVVQTAAASGEPPGARQCVLRVLHRPAQILPMEQMPGRVW